MGHVYMKEAKIVSMIAMPMIQRLESNWMMR